MTRNRNKREACIGLFPLLFVLFIGYISSVGTAAAAEMEDLRNKIQDRSRKIQEIEREIQEYEKQLVEVGEERSTLQSAVERLDISRRKIGADINLTENRMETASLEIDRLALDIDDKEGRILRNRAVIAQTLRSMNEIESDSFVELVLVYDDVGDVWERVEALERFQIVMREDIKELTLLKYGLEENKKTAEQKQDELIGYRNQLAGQKQALDANRAEKNDLLTVTKNEENNYQKLLEDRRAAREQFERELQEFEAQLEFALDPSAIPQTGQGILEWPVDNPVVTQFFGNTRFARSGAYNGQGHNGMDLRASIGTRAKSALGGVVVETGNTDEVRGCYSYGKWVLVRHNNGLSTLYAHLSVISVSAGQSVATGEVIGFSGNTGYSTGPHLHFGAYLSDAVKVVRLGDIKTITNCGAARIPVAPLPAYLNPLDYLQVLDNLPTSL